MQETTKIDRVDRKLLVALERDARLPVSELARAARVSRTVAEYRLERLHDHGIIRGYYCLIDSSAFGLTVWKLWVTLAGNPEERKRFFAHITRHPTIWWYAETAGVWDAVLCVLAADPHDFNAFLTHLQETFGTLITDTVVLINVSFEYHSRGWLLGTRSSMLGTSFQEKPKARPLSSASMELLRLLSRDSRAGYAALAHATGKDARTIKSTITDLQNNGVIVYFRPSINVARLGMEYYKVLLYLHNPRGLLPAVVEWCRQHPNVMAVISCVGPWQLELEVEIDSYKRLCAMLTLLRDEFPNVIRQYESLLVTREGNYDLDLIDKILRLGKV